MKNEVKKKMHEVERALLHQSHRETRVKKKISKSFDQNQSCARNRELKRAGAILRALYPSVVCGESQGGESALQKLIVFDRFRRPRIYNESCEIFVGA